MRHTVIQLESDKVGGRDEEAAVTAFGTAGAVEDEARAAMATVCAKQVNPPCEQR